MIAITSGLNTPPIRRLKRTWEQVNQRCMAQFGACEMTIDSNKNFTKYRQLMASVTPPCVPFIGKSIQQSRFPGPPLTNFFVSQAFSSQLYNLFRMVTPIYYLGDLLISGSVKKLLRSLTTSSVGRLSLSTSPLSPPFLIISRSLWVSLVTHERRVNISGLSV